MPRILATSVDREECAERIREKLVRAFCAGLGVWGTEGAWRRMERLVGIVVLRASSAEPERPSSDTEGVLGEEQRMPAGGLWRRLAARCLIGAGGGADEPGAETDIASTFLWDDEADLGSAQHTVGMHRPLVELVPDSFPRPVARLRSFLREQPGEEGELGPGFSETVFETRPRCERAIRARIVYEGHAPPPLFVVD